MGKSLVGKSSILAMPTVVAGALVNGKPNYLTLGAFGLMSVNPPMLYISVNKAHFTNTGIKANGYYSVNFPSKEQAQKTDYVGLVSGKDTDKSGVFTAFYGSVNKAPMIKEFPACVLCKVTSMVDLPNNEVFIGEIVETWVNNDCLTEGKPDIRKINPLVLAGGGYCEIGNKVADAFSSGRALIKK
jgi:flavin reductase (DIM6/NTAB) family NADH-FMN oxidoreductase RutF